MKQFIKFLKEDPDQPDNTLKNPSLMHNDYKEAVTAAKKMAQEQTNAQDRAYILSYKYYQQEHIKQYVVIYNKTLLSQAPDWEAKGYTIVGWVSNQDGVVVKTPDGKYVKDQGNNLNEEYDVDNKMYNKFITFAAEYLKIKKPSIVFTNKILDTETGKTFGTTKDDKIKISTYKRHPFDVCRTIAHEMVHLKQYFYNELNSKSGDTGSKHENEANATAGIIMRLWAKKHPELFK